MEFKAFFVIAILFLIIPVMADTETYYSSSDIVTYPAAKNITFGEIINTSATGSSTTSTTLVSLMANWTPGTNNFSQLRRYVTTFNDTGSCIPASARIKIWSISKTSGLGTTGFGITAVNATPAGFPVVYTDYNKVGHLRYSNIISYADLPTANWMTLELNSDGMAALTADGNFSLALVSTWDANMSFTGTWASNGTNIWLANQSSAAGTIFDPYLEITCEEAPTPTPTPTPPPVGSPTSSFTSNVTCGSIPFWVQFTDTSAGSPDEWNWTSNGNYSTGQNPAFYYDTIGRYSVNLNATNSFGSTYATNYIRAVPDWYECPPETTRPVWTPEINPPSKDSLISLILKFLKGVFK